MTSNSIDYEFLMSVGAYDTAIPNKIIFGAFVATVGTYYNLTHNSILLPFNALTSATYSAVIVLNENLYYNNVNSLSYSFLQGSGDNHIITPIFSTNRGVSWAKSNVNQTFTTGFASQTFTFDNLTVEAANINDGVRVGFLFENNDNQDALNMMNPQVTIVHSPINHEDQANAFAQEINDYSPCATEQNGMLQLTPEKKLEFNKKYNHLSTEAKSLLSTIPMGTGFTALDRYLYLINSNV
jgi:hypothetical protein